MRPSALLWAVLFLFIRQQGRGAMGGGGPPLGAPCDRSGCCRPAPAAHSLRPLALAFP